MTIRINEEISKDLCQKLRKRFIGAFEPDATVSDIIAILKRLETQGYGDYVVMCNGERAMAGKSESGEVHHPSKTIDFLGSY